MLGKSELDRNCFCFQSHVAVIESDLSEWTPKREYSRGSDTLECASRAGSHSGHRLLELPAQSAASFLPYNKTRLKI